MATSATTYGGYPLQDSGDNLNTWGTDSTAGLNNALGLLAEGVHSVLTVALTGNTTLTSTNYASNQFRRRGLILTDGGLSAAPTVTAPSVQAVYLIWNATGYTVSFKTSGGSAVSLATGMGHVVSCDATSMYVLTARRLDQIDAPTAAVDLNSQKITSLATGTATTDAVNKGQMDTAIASAGIPASTGAVLISANDTTSRYLGAALTAGAVVALTENNDGADETLTVAVDVVGLTAETSAADADLVLIYDDSEAAYRKMTRANLLATLPATTATGAIAMGGNAISGAEGVKDIGGAWNAIGTTASAVTLDYTAYNGATFEPTGNLTVSVTNLPAGYSDGGFIITGGGDHTLTFSGFDATMVADLPTLQTTTGVDHLVWWSPDGGTSIYIKHVGVS